MKSEQWQCSAYGKHPAVKDFFNVGQGFSSMGGVTDWIEKGYHLLKPKPAKGNVLEGYSWRFWAKEPHKEGIICGVLKDSSDSFGRPYPLLIMGTGIIRDWEKDWDLVPYACENAWGQMEQLAVGTYNELKQLEKEVQKIRSPDNDLLLFASRRDVFKKRSQQDMSALEREALKTLQIQENFICLDGNRFYDPFEVICMHHIVLKAHMKTPPNAVFMGGTLKSTYIVIFKRPLVPDDFVRLWSQG